MNSEYCKTGGTDYLALMGCPEEAAPQAPRYVNGKLIAELGMERPKKKFHPQLTRIASLTFSCKCFYRRRLRANESKIWERHIQPTSTR